MYFRPLPFCATIGPDANAKPNERSFYHADQHHSPGLRRHGIPRPAPPAAFGRTESRGCGPAGIQPAGAVEGVCRHPPHPAHGRHAGRAAGAGRNRLRQRGPEFYRLGQRRVDAGRCQRQWLHRLHPARPVRCPRHPPHRGRGRRADPLGLRAVHRPGDGQRQRRRRGRQTRRLRRGERQAERQRGRFFCPADRRQRHPGCRLCRAGRSRC